MALYEGIALIQEKQAVVLDLGYDYTKFGFTGEAAPRCIIRSEFWCPTERRFKRVHEYKTPEELYDNLVQMLHLLYFRHVLVNPKERKVVVVESLLTPTLFRETLAKVLFNHYEVSGVVWADSPRLCALTLGTAVSLIVSIGAREAEVAAVVHASVVLRALQSQPLAARAIHDELARLLDEDNGQELHLSDDVIEDIKVKTCFVIPRARALQWSSASPPAGAAAVRYPRAGRSAVAVSGRARELAAEPLFARDNELASLPDIVLQCIMQCPIDARRALADNILVTGGTAALPGLRARLAQELKVLVTQPPYNEHLYIQSFKFHSAPAHCNTTAWVGGAVGGAEGGAARALSREAWARARRLRDWVCLLDNTPHDHPHREHLDI
ncbi:actin-related protein 10 [Plodia interpunctella]|uniref:actin-related protein 10 n=1 Tax=Plodia interpunctella TaxID=58824 RepID=UPI00236802A5|nr:actin-related protein 10 [Plodia interpunctella]